MSVELELELELVKKVLKTWDFTIHSRSMGNSWVYFTDDEGLGIEVSFTDRTFQVIANIAGCIRIEYSKLGLQFLLGDSRALELAISRVERLATSRAANNLRQEFIEQMSK